MESTYGKIRIAFLGCDSSHLESYVNLIHDKELDFWKKVSIELIWDEDYMIARTKAKSLNINKVYEKLSQIPPESIDLVMVIGRYGSEHYNPARWAILNHKKTFIDKPLTDDYSEAKSLVKLAEEKKVNIFSFSPLKFSDEIIKLKSLINEYKNKPYLTMITIPFYTNSIKNLKKIENSFYSIHSIDMALEIYNSFSKKIDFYKNSNGFFMILKLLDGNTIILNYPKKSQELFSLNAFWEHKHMNFKVDLDGDFFKNTFSRLINNSNTKLNKIAPISYSLESIKIINKIKKYLNDEI